MWQNVNNIRAYLKALGSKTTDFTSETTNHTLKSAIHVCDALYVCAKIERCKIAARVLCNKTLLTFTEPETCSTSWKYDPLEGRTN